MHNKQLLPILYVKMQYKFCPAFLYQYLFQFWSSCLQSTFCII